MRKILLLGFIEKGKIQTGGQAVDQKYIGFLKKKSDAIIEEKSLADVGLVKKIYTKADKKGIAECLSGYDVIFFDERIFPNLAFLIAYLRSCLNNTKIYVILHHFLFTQYSFPRKYIIKALEIYALQYMDYVLFAGIYPYEVSKKINKLKKEKLQYIGIGFDKEELINRDPIYNQNILFIGHIIPRKGIYYLLRALSELKRKYDYCPSTVIIGNDKINPDFTRKMNKLIKKKHMEDYVKFTGRISDEEKNNYIKSSGVFVFPSLCEGFGMVLLETMQYGIPAIVFNNTNLPYIVKDGYNGFVVMNKDWKAIAAKIIELKNGNLYKQLQLGAIHTYSSALTWEDVGNRFEKWMNKQDDA